MRKLRGIFFAVTVIAMASFGSIYAGPADEVASQVGDNTTFFGVSVGKSVPLICDNYGYQWSLTISSPGKLTGTVLVGTCGIWDVTGTYDAVNINLKATNHVTSCCPSMTYTGTHTGKKGKTASGSWTNECGSSGKWTAGLCK